MGERGRGPVRGGGGQGGCVQRIEVIVKMKKVGGGGGAGSDQGLGVGRGSKVWGSG